MMIVIGLVNTILQIIIETGRGSVLLLLIRRHLESHLNPNPQIHRRTSLLMREPNRNMLSGEEEYKRLNIPGAFFSEFDESQFEEEIDNLSETWLLPNKRTREWDEQYWRGK